MLKHIALVITLLAFATFSKAQNFSINNGVDTTDTEIKRSIGFLQDYVSRFKVDSTPDYRKYWSKKDCDTHFCPDPIVFAVAGDYPTYRMSYNISVLYARPTADYVHVKLLLINNIDSAGNVATLAVSNHYIKFDSTGHPYFVRPIEINTKDWKQTNVRNVTFVYSAQHPFNQLKADSLITSIQSLERAWQLSPVHFTYYLGSSYEEIQKMRGLEYCIGTGNRDKPSGMSDYRDSAVYCGGLGENYFHEVVHLYLNPKFPKSPLKEGLATFYGGSMGHELKWHLLRLKTYLNEHPEVDLNHLDDFGYLDNYTNSKSAIQGLLCLLAYKKDATNGLKRIMEYTSMKDVFLKEFNVSETGWNVFLRKEINQIE